MAQSTIGSDSWKQSGAPLKTQGSSKQPQERGAPRSKRGEVLTPQLAAPRTSAAKAKPTKSVDAKPVKSSRVRGIGVDRRFTTRGVDPFEAMKWERRSSVITNPDGSVVFKMVGAEIPAEWSQLATDIVVSKYFRKAGLHGNKSKGETSVRQVVTRISQTIREAGESFGGYFATAKDADAFEAELNYLLVHQYGAFNSPVWFNCGLFHRYGIAGSGRQLRGLLGSPHLGRAPRRSPASRRDRDRNAYERPQCSACFIQAVDDDLMSIYELVKNEARLFKYGSGTGTNFSAIRGKQEKLSGGGTSSGLMSFLEVFDRAAGATKSGGTTRRAAKMVCLDMDHPEIVDFIQWKVREEKKAQALIAAGLPSDFNGEAYHTVSGQNSNNSIRVTDAFMRAVDERRRVADARPHHGRGRRHLPREGLWRQAGRGRVGLRRPGRAVRHDHQPLAHLPEQRRASTRRTRAPSTCSSTTRPATCRASTSRSSSTRMAASTSRATATRARVLRRAGDPRRFLAPTRPSTIAKNSHDYRPLGLGYANLGTLLMLMGLPYDSDEGRAVAGALTAIMCGTPTGLGRDGGTKGPSPASEEPRAHAARHAHAPRRGLRHRPRQLPRGPGARACEDWDEAVKLGRSTATATRRRRCSRPPARSACLMDCDTTGIEPDFALVKFKKLAGGGYFKIVNQSVPSALRRLGYREARCRRSSPTSPAPTRCSPRSARQPRDAQAARPDRDDDLAKVEAPSRACSISSSRSARGCSAKSPTSASACPRPSAHAKPGFSLLRHLGFTPAQIDEANETSSAA
jgi:ribonucleoside-diphosphate reductase alpha chain